MKIIWLRIQALIIKELIAVWQDKRSRMVLIVPPMIQLFVFTFAATLDVQNITMGILNRDTGHQSYELIQRLQGSPYFENILMLDSEQEIKNKIDIQKTFLVVHIDENFSRNIAKNAPAKLQVLSDGRKSNSAQIAQGYLFDIVERFNEDLSARREASKPRSEIIPRNWYNPNLIYPWFTLTGLIGTISMLTSISVTALSIAREKETGTFEQLLLCPLNALQILIGKSIPAIFIGVAEGSFLMLAGVLLLDLPVRGNLLFFYPSMVVFILAIVGIGLFISSLSRTQQQATLGVFLIASPLIITSGFATPIENMPQWLQWVAVFNPLKYFLIITRGVCLKDIPFVIIFNNTWPMLFIGIFTLGAAAWLFRKQVG